MVYIMLMFALIILLQVINIRHVESIVKSFNGLINKQNDRIDNLSKEIQKIQLQKNNLISYI